MAVTIGFLVVAICFATCGALLSLLFLRRSLKNNATFKYKVRDPDGIEILESITLGGIKQWIHIRGRSKENPLLLFLHGGPGLPHIGWFDEIQRPWEDYFTVVQWDQRQQGKSYASIANLGDSISNQKMLSDSSELIAYLRQRFKQKKIFLMAKSYGTYLAMHMVKCHPEWLHAYIADGQIINVKDYIEGEYQHLLAYARENNKKVLIEKLEAMAPRIDPKAQWQSFVANEFIIRAELEKIGKGLSPRFSRINQFQKMITINQWCSPLLSLKDHWHRITGDKDAASYPKPHTFKQQFLAIDIPNELGSTFDVPIFVFTGRHDWHVSCEDQERWFNALNVPYKQQVWFERTTHMPYLEEPGKYLMALVNNVLPLSSKEAN